MTESKNIISVKGDKIMACRFASSEYFVTYLLTYLPLPLWTKDVEQRVAATWNETYGFPCHQAWGAALRLYE